jgi:hypothetical protein
LFLLTLRFVLQDMHKRCEDADAKWNAVESEMAELLAGCESDEERQAILKHLAPIKSKLSDVKCVVDLKAAAHSVLVEYTEACNEASGKIAHLQDALLSADLSPDQILELRSDLEMARDQLRLLESRKPEIEAIIADADVVIRDPSSHEIVDMWKDCEELLADIGKGDVKLKFCEQVKLLEDKLKATGADAGELKDVYGDELGSSGSTLKVQCVFC